MDDTIIITRASRCLSIMNIYGAGRRRRKASRTACLNVVLLFHKGHFDCGRVFLPFFVFWTVLYQFSVLGLMIEYKEDSSPK